MVSFGKWFVIIGFATVVIGLFFMKNSVDTANFTAQQLPSVESVDIVIDQSSSTVITVGEFTNLIPLTLGSVSLMGSIADTDDERAQGLSGTNEIPAEVAKVFIFETAAKWSFWMKDMNYPIDIFWLDENGVVVHIEESVSPETYPEKSFMPPVPALYVIETKAGFAQGNNIMVGISADMTQIVQGQ
jgi:hypothetical protein